MIIKVVRQNNNKKNLLPYFLGFLLFSNFSKIKLHTNKFILILTPPTSSLDYMDMDITKNRRK